jgi:hypothetical protein
VSAPTPANRTRRPAAHRRRRRLLHYERYREPLLSPAQYRMRLARHAGFALGVIGVSLLFGIVGYRLTGHYAWLDCLYNASMILGGMGPVSGDASITPRAVKWFASFYALYSGMALLTSVGVLFAPVMHRILHRFHLAGDDDED